LHVLNAFTTLLKIKVFIGIHDEIFPFHKQFFTVENVSLDFLNVLHAKKEKVILRTDP